ncbi:hypothetical protein [Xanthobacter sp. KR7-225]|uniref:hypothetical protein n=1 Tax=Xanthobacter sp. KR7-225 TaxID=3156613 RepID=UPI0032B57944
MVGHLGRVFGGLVAGAVLLAGAGMAQAKQTSTVFRTVGQWRIETVYEDGKLFLCRAVTGSGASQVNVIKYPNNRWAISVPDMNFPKGTKLTGMMEIGRASQPISTTALDPGVRERFFLDAGTFEAMKQGGRMSVTLGGRTFAWTMNDAGQATGAVEDCLTTALKAGGAVSTPAAPATTPGKQIATPFRTVGQWRIETVFENGKIVLCRGVTGAGASQVNVILYPNSRWAVSMADMNFPKGTKLAGMLEIGRASQPISTVAQDPGVRERFFLDAGTVEAMRQGGRMSATLAGKTVAWQMNDAGQMFGAVQDCMAAARKSGG